jgi:hypothetical protein
MEGLEPRGRSQRGQVTLGSSAPLRAGEKSASRRSRLISSKPV